MKIRAINWETDDRMKVVFNSEQRILLPDTTHRILTISQISNFTPDEPIFKKIFSSQIKYVAIKFGSYY